MSTKFKVLLIIGIALSSISSEAQILNLPKIHLQNETYTYPEVIEIYRQFDSASENCVMIELGLSDQGLPIHALILTDEKTEEGNLEELRSTRWVMAVNNGIHPGESCGIDASLHWINDLLSQPEELGNAMVVVVPVYNIGGALNRSCCSRANQNGPISQGFRGNARNFDLNRDLIKADTRNTLALYRLFNLFDPEIFVDTHSTNGADYPYEITLITSPWQKYPEPLQPLVRSMESTMLDEMSERGVLMFPYVNVFGRTPNSGFPVFMEGAMYTTGFAALTGAVAFVAEAHMLKPYDVRVNATQQFLSGALLQGEEYGPRIIEAKRAYRSSPITRYPLDWEIVEDAADTLDFFSFEAEMKPSEVTSGQRLQYSKHVEEVRVPYFNRLKATLTVVVPESYYIPIGQWTMLDRFTAAGVEMDTIYVDPSDRMLVEQFKFDSYSYLDAPYEGHQVIKELDVSLDRLFLPEGYYVRARSHQKMGRYLQECLHPLGPTSFARWNFFAAYLQQKEHYSSYVFEDTAEELLNSDEDLREQFEIKMEEDEAFRSNPQAQLYFIYINSPYYEVAHKHLPYYLSID